MKKILSTFLTVSLLLSGAQSAFAAGPKVLFEIDCNTLNKNVNVGFHADEDDPQNGEEIIAYEFTLTLEPSSGTVLDDLKDAKIEPNTAITNMIVAQNTSAEVNNTRELKIAAGFTQQTGLTTSDHLFSISGVAQKAYKITVKDGKLFPKSGVDDIYPDTAPQQSFTVEPSTCQTTSTSTNQTASTSVKTVVIENFSFSPSEVTIKVGDSVEWTNNDSTAHTVTSVGAGPLDSGNLDPGEKYSQTFTEKGTFEYQCTIHPSMTGRVIVEEASTTSSSSTTSSTTSTDTSSQTQGELSISMSSTPELANPNDEVVVTAIIENRGTQAIEWSQTSGSRITPTIENKALEDGKTQSDLKFNMPTPATDITVRAKVGDTTESHTVKGADETTTNAADSSEDTTPAASNNTSNTSSLQERLQERREELQNNAGEQPSGTLHSAAGTGLVRSGPEHTALAIALLSAGLVVLSRRKKSVSEY